MDSERLERKKNWMSGVKSGFGLSCITFDCLNLIIKWKSFLNRTFILLAALELNFNPINMFMSNYKKKRKQNNNSKKKSTRKWSENFFTNHSKWFIFLTKQHQKLFPFRFLFKLHKFCFSYKTPQVKVFHAKMWIKWLFYKIRFYQHEWEHFQSGCKVFRELLKNVWVVVCLVFNKGNSFIYTFFSSHTFVCTERKIKWNKFWSLVNNLKVNYIYWNIYIDAIVSKYEQ